MTDRDLRRALVSALELIEKLVAQVNEVTIANHAVRMAIADENPAMTVRIHKKYLKLVKTTNPSVEEVTSSIQNIVRSLTPTR